MISRVKAFISPSARSGIGRAIRNLKRESASAIGGDFVVDVRSRLARLHVETVFDVGAHIGMTALEFSDRFPGAVVHAFEPGIDNFKRMEANLTGKPAIRKYRLGFGAEKTESQLFMDPDHPSMARLVQIGGGNTEVVAIDTIDRFCREYGIASIDVLKIDTEGHEIQVLAGAEAMLTDSKIAIIKAEVAVDPDSNYHTSFFAFSDQLHRKGYRLFGIYDQFEDTLNPGPKLRRFDAAFISSHFR